MIVTRLPNGKAISPLGFGCSSLWAKPRFDAEEAHTILLAAEAAGINHYDTGPSYGVGELRLGRFLKDRDPNRLVISTKIGTHQASDGSLSRSFAPDRIRASFEMSLLRLGVPKVDILYLHGPSLADLSSPVLQFLHEQKAAGRADYVGINSFDPAVVKTIPSLDLDVVMLQYSIADLRFEKLIPCLHAAGKIVIAATILGQSIFDRRTFLPKNSKAIWYFLRAFKNDPAFPFKGVIVARRLRKTGIAPHDAAIRFAVGHPLITSCLFGSTRSEHIAANVAAASRPMDADLRARLGSSFFAANII